MSLTVCRHARSHFTLHTLATSSTVCRHARSMEPPVSTSVANASSSSSPHGSDALCVHGSNAHGERASHQEAERPHGHSGSIVGRASSSHGALVEDTCTPANGAARVDHIGTHGDDGHACAGVEAPGGNASAHPEAQHSQVHGKAKPLLDASFVQYAALERPELRSGAAPGHSFECKWLDRVLCYVTDVSWV